MQKRKSTWCLILNSTVCFSNICLPLTLCLCLWHPAELTVFWVQRKHWINTCWLTEPNPKAGYSNHKVKAGRGQCQFKPVFLVAASYSFLAKLWVEAGHSLWPWISMCVCGGGSLPDKSHLQLGFLCLQLPIFITLQAQRVTGTSPEGNKYTLLSIKLKYCFIVSNKTSWGEGDV